MKDHIREAFETVSCPSFGHELTYPRKPNGEYYDPKLEDHWQTFQEGWEAAVEYLKRNGGNYSDIISDGGMDPRR